MSKPTKSRKRFSVWTIMAIAIPILVALAVLIIVLIDRGGQVGTTFQYQLY